MQVRRRRARALSQRSLGGKWYFTTREGFDSGPFSSRERAEMGLKRFLHVVRMLPEDQKPH